MATTPSVNPAPGATATPPPSDARRATDVALSVVFLALQLVFTLVSFPFSYFASMFAGDGGLGPYAGLGFFLFLAGPSVVFIISLGVDVFLLVKKRRTWVIALVGLVASGGIWILGLWLLGIK
jgi:hypothetical protein